MERFKKLTTEFKGFVFGFVLSIALVGGVVYAWQAVWHGTDWIEHGGVIDAQKVAENFEYLKKEIEALKLKTVSIPEVFISPAEQHASFSEDEINLGSDWHTVIVRGEHGGNIDLDFRHQAVIQKTVTGDVRVKGYFTGWWEETPPGLSDFILQPDNQYVCYGPFRFNQHNVCYKLDSNGNLYFKRITGTKDRPVRGYLMSYIILKYK